MNYYQQPNLTPIFKIQPDSTHSLYIDGVPNDTTEREVARNSLIKFEIFFAHFLVIKEFV